MSIHLNRKVIVFKNIPYERDGPADFHPGFRRRSGNIKDHCTGACATGEGIRIVLLDFLGIYPFLGQRHYVG